MLLTNNPDLDARARLLRSHGITRDAGRMEGVADGPWYYQQIELGFNYRITDMQAALGLSQLGRLEQFLGRRRDIAAGYARLLADVPVTLPWQRPGAESAWHLYVIRVGGDGPHGRRAVFEALQAAGIRVNVHYIPVHLQPYYSRMGFSAGDFPEAERYYEEAISLPMYFGLGDSDQRHVAEQLGRILS
jgi:dTDP-4-amino-4,6-dideoxygalactose transaminase